VGKPDLGGRRRAGGAVGVEDVVAHQQDALADARRRNQRLQQVVRARTSGRRGAADVSRHQHDVTARQPAPTPAAAAAGQRGDRCHGNDRRQHDYD